MQGFSQRSTMVGVGNMLDQSSITWQAICSINESLCFTGAWCMSSTSTEYESIFFKSVTDVELNTSRLIQDVYDNYEYIILIKHIPCSKQIYSRYCKLYVVLFCEGFYFYSSEQSDMKLLSTRQSSDMKPMGQRKTISNNMNVNIYLQ